MKICLSIAKMDAEFSKMIESLQPYAQVDVVGLTGFSLEGYDIFIGKKLTAQALATADRLKIAFAYKTGVDDFPLKKMQEKGIILVNTHVDAAPVHGAQVQPGSQHTLGLVQVIGVKLFDVGSGVTGGLHGGGGNGAPNQHDGQHREYDPL